VVFGGVDAEGSDGTTAKLFDPAGNITQLKLATS